MNGSETAEVDEAFSGQDRDVEKGAEAVTESEGFEGFRSSELSEVSQ